MNFDLTIRARFLAWHSRLYVDLASEWTSEALADVLVFFFPDFCYQLLEYRDPVFFEL